MAQNQGSSVRIETAAEFLTQMVLPDYEELLRNPTDLRKAFHLATSLFQLRDWVFLEFGSQRWASVEQLQQFLQNKCTDFGLIRDVSNASKHLRLTSPSTPATGVTWAGDTFATLVATGLALSSARHYQGGSDILIAVDSGVPVRFAKVAENVIKMWQQLFKDEGWQ